MRLRAYVLPDSQLEKTSGRIDLNWTMLSAMEAIRINGNEQFEFHRAWELACTKIKLSKV